MATNISVDEPSSTIDGDWLVLSVSNIWFSKEGKDQENSTSAGMTLEPGWQTELRLAVPLTDRSDQEQPRDTLTLEQLHERLMTPVAQFVDGLVHPAPPRVKGTK